MSNRHFNKQTPNQHVPPSARPHAISTTKLQGVVSKVNLDTKSTEKPQVLRAR